MDLLASFADDVPWHRRLLGVGQCIQEPAFDSVPVRVQGDSSKATQRRVLEQGNGSGKPIRGLDRPEPRTVQRLNTRMSHRPLRLIYSADRRCRVCVFQRLDGTFGFREERFSNEPHEQCWIPVGRHTESFCSSEEVVLRESIGRVPWLQEMVARFDEIDGLPRRTPAGPPPDRLDGVSAICYTPLDRRHTHTGNCRHLRDDMTQGPAAGLAICQYPNDSSFYLFGCDADWTVISDTWHPTLDEAKSQAEFEYAGVSSTWQQFP